MSNLRSRSVSRSRVTKLSTLFPSGESLDPVALLSDLLPHITDLNVPLSIDLSDSSDSVSFLLSVFIQKEYEISGEFVKFGFKKLKLRELKASVSFDIVITNDE